MAKRRVYWDACVFIGLLNAETGKIDSTLNIWREAERGETEIWTSAFSMIEVYKTKCEGKLHSLDPVKEQAISDLFTQPFIEVVLVDPSVALLARRILRQFHPACKKPTDGLHIASAARWNLDELHTWDGSDILPLNGLVNRNDGKPLTICKPYELEQPKAPKSSSPQTAFFES